VAGAPLSSFTRLCRACALLPALRARSFESPRWLSPACALLLWRLKSLARFLVAGAPLSSFTRLRRACALLPALRPEALSRLAGSHQLALSSCRGWSHRQALTWRAPVETLHPLAAGLHSTLQPCGLRASSRLAGSHQLALSTISREWLGSQPR